MPDTSDITVCVPNVFVKFSISIIAVSSDFCFPLFTRYYLFSRSCYTVISFRLVPIPAMTNKTIQIITFAGIIMF